MNVLKFKLKHCTFIFNCWFNRKVFDNKIISVTYSEKLRRVGKSYYINKLAKKYNAIIVNPYPSNITYSKGITVVKPRYMLEAGRRINKYILVDEGCPREELREILFRYGDKVIMAYC